jgi:hypothetical protein
VAARASPRRKATRRKRERAMVSGAEEPWWSTKGGTVVLRRGSVVRGRLTTCAEVGGARRSMASFGEHGGARGATAGGEGGGELRWEVPAATRGRPLSKTATKVA